MVQSDTVRRTIPAEIPVVPPVMVRPGNPDRERETGVWDFNAEDLEVGHARCRRSGHRQDRGAAAGPSMVISVIRFGSAVESVIVPVTEGSNTIVSAVASRLACVMAARSEPGPESPVFMTVITAGNHPPLPKTRDRGTGTKPLRGRGGRGATSGSTPGGGVRRGGVRRPDGPAGGAARPTAWANLTQIIRTGKSSYYPNIKIKF